MPSQSILTYFVVQVTPAYYGHFLASCVPYAASSACVPSVELHSVCYVRHNTEHFDTYRVEMVGAFDPPCS